LQYRGGARVAITDGGQIRILAHQQTEQAEDRQLRKLSGLADQRQQIPPVFGQDQQRQDSAAHQRPHAHQPDGRHAEGFKQILPAGAGDAPENAAD